MSHCISIYQVHEHQRVSTNTKILIFMAPLALYRHTYNCSKLNCNQITIQKLLEWTHELLRIWEIFPITNQISTPFSRQQYYKYNQTQLASYLFDLENMTTNSPSPYDRSLTRCLNDADQDDRSLAKCFKETGGTEAASTTFLQAFKGLDPHYPFKMLLIGETGSGKTSFLNLLYNHGNVQALGYGFGKEGFNIFDSSTTLS